MGQRDLRGVAEIHFRVGRESLWGWPPICHPAGGAVGFSISGLGVEILGSAFLNPEASRPESVSTTFGVESFRS